MRIKLFKLIWKQVVVVRMKAGGVIELLHDLRVSAAVDGKEADGHSSEPGAGNGTIGKKVLSPSLPQGCG